MVSPFSPGYRNNQPQSRPLYELDRFFDLLNIALAYDGKEIDASKIRLSHPITEVDEVKARIFYHLAVDVLVQLGIVREDRSIPNNFIYDSSTAELYKTSTGLIPVDITQSNLEDLLKRMTTLDYQIRG